MSRWQRDAWDLGLVLRSQLSLDWITFIPRRVADINREKENFLLLCADVARGFGSDIFMVRGISETIARSFLFSFFFSPFPRSAWTTAFSLSVTRFFCLGNISTVGILWLQLGTPLIYFALWFIALVIHWLRKSWNKPAALPNSSYRLSLLNHLIDHEYSAESDSIFDNRIYPLHFFSPVEDSVCTV